LKLLYSILKLLYSITKRQTYSYNKFITISFI